jgi:hypothetical protein
MFAKPRSAVFIDSVVFEVDHKEPSSSLRAVLKDEQGCVMSSLEAEIPQGQKNYGVYVLEVKTGDNETRVRMIKRV